MAIVTTDFLSALLTNFRAMFATDFEGGVAAQDWQDLAAQVQTPGSEGNSYNWFGTVPRMEDVTNRQAARQGLPSFNFVIRNREWQSILEVERAALERDQLGLITPRINQMAMEAARHPSELVMMLVEANPELNWQDELERSLNLGPFFGSGRTIGNSTDINNIVSGTGITVEQIQNDLAVARARMRMFTDDNARPLNRIGNIIMTPVALEQRMYQALNANQGTVGAMPTLPASGLANAAGYKIIVNPYLTDEDDWYLMHSSGAVNKPFVFQLEKPPELNASTNPNEQAVIESRKFLYSAYARYNVGLSDPRFIVKVDNS